MDLHKTFLLALLLASKFLGKSAVPDKFCYLSGNTDFSKRGQASQKNAHIIHKRPQFYCIIAQMYFFAQEKGHNSE